MNVKGEKASEGMNFNGNGARYFAFTSTKRRRPLYSRIRCDVGGGPYCVYFRVD
jgi:hypothetical protein